MHAEDAGDGTTYTRPDGVIQLHASCAARDGSGILLLGAPGAGKSDLLLRLIDRGFTLVSDDRTWVADGVAWPPPALEGLLEVRGLGVLRLPWRATAMVRLVIALDEASGAVLVPLQGNSDATADRRLPWPMRHPGLELPALRLDPRPASAPLVAELALDVVLGRRKLLAGAFASFPAGVVDDPRG
ncbi:HPr kinase/phosphorylase [Rhizosaccharibacter radicis]|uniref:Phosphotransferase n=1 Tax=Rhizosaccharibacter radicis TaxID=2782605 RepID=A0ABT1VSX4_9PROT|nr:phosphotransferase [Acetobacteraceae bacterium KSS12]